MRITLRTAGWCTSAETDSSQKSDSLGARDGEFRLRHAAAAIADLPDGPHKDKLRVDYARTMLSRVPR
jgi:hypothetical protein